MQPQKRCPASCRRMLEVNSRNVVFVVLSSLFWPWPPQPAQANSAIQLPPPSRRRAGVSRSVTLHPRARRQSRNLQQPRSRLKRSLQAYARNSPVPSLFCWLDLKARGAEAPPTVRERMSNLPLTRRLGLPASPRSREDLTSEPVFGSQCSQVCNTVKGCRCAVWLAFYVPSMPRPAPHKQTLHHMAARLVRLAGAIRERETAVLGALVQGPTSQRPRC